MGLKFEIWKLLFGSFEGKVKYQKFWNSLYKHACIGMNVGCGGDFNSSGESNAIKYLKDNIFDVGETLTVFDVGANIGDYANNLLKSIPDCRIHCFEPAEKTFKKLVSNVKDSRVKFNNFGLSDEIANKNLYYDKEESGWATLYQQKIPYYKVEFGKYETIALKTIDDYCKENDICRIDFLKIDVEGNEFKTLLGANRMIQSDGIVAIQVEFGNNDIDARVFFADFWIMLKEKYRTYRICLDGLYEIKEYDEYLEIFSCTNFMFIHR